MDFHTRLLFGWGLNFSTQKNIQLVLRGNCFKSEEYLGMLYREKFLRLSIIACALLINASCSDAKFTLTNILDGGLILSVDWAEDGSKAIVDFYGEQRVLTEVDPVSGNVLTSYPVDAWDYSAEPVYWNTPGDLVLYRTSSLDPRTGLGE